MISREQDGFRAGGLLDLYAPKFGLDELKSSGEKIILKVVVESAGRRTLFASYAIRNRHIQIRTKKLVETESVASVLPVSRYSEDDFAVEFNDALSRQVVVGNPRIVQNAGLYFQVDGRNLPAKLREMYTAASRVYAVIECQGKELRIGLGDDVELFDLQRRKLVGVRLEGKDLVLLRSFQHKERERADHPL